MTRRLGELVIFQIHVIRNDFNILILHCRLNVTDQTVVASSCGAQTVSNSPPNDSALVKPEVPVGFHSRIQHAFSRNESDLRVELALFPTQNFLSDDPEVLLPGGWKRGYVFPG